MSKSIGTALQPLYYSDRVQDIKDRAVRTLRWSWSPKAKEEAQDVLDLLYTAMLFGMFEDYKPQPAGRIEYP